MLTDAELLALHRALVTIPSVSGTEKALVDFLEEWLDSRGVAAERFGESLLATCGAVQAQTAGGGAAPVAPATTAAVVLQPPTAPILTLRALFESALATHPLLQSARLQARAASQDIAAMERQRWPTLSLVAETDTAQTTTSSASRVLANMKISTGISNC